MFFLVFFPTRTTIHTGDCRYDSVPSYKCMCCTAPYLAFNFFFCHTFLFVFRLDINTIFVRLYICLPPHHEHALVPLLSSHRRRRRHDESYIHYLIDNEDTKSKHTSKTYWTRIWNLAYVQKLKLLFCKHTSKVASPYQGHQAAP